ncbi:MAG: EamA family transporter [Nanoarchaeota archaeon]
MEDKRKAILIIMASVVIISVAQLLLKYGVKHTTGTLTDASTLQMLEAIFSSGIVLSAVALLLVSSTLWLIGLSKAELSFAYPLLGTGYALVSFFSWIIFNEAMGITRVIGIATIITGVILMSRS